VTAAWEGRFADFVRLAIRGRLPSYATFFGFGGPAWTNTRLVHFDDVATGLERACRDFGLDVSVELPRKNCRPEPQGGRSAPVIAPTLEAEVRRHFAWYHATFAASQSPIRRAA
jgi:hypothetical protein